jgi:hypothetical protein
MWAAYRDRRDKVTDAGSNPRTSQPRAAAPHHMLLHDQRLRLTPRAATYPAAWQQRFTARSAAAMTVLGVNERRLLSAVLAVPRRVRPARGAQPDFPMAVDSRRLDPIRLNSAMLSPVPRSGVPVP